MRIVFLIKFLILTLVYSQFGLASPSSPICTPASSKIQNKNVILPGLDNPRSMTPKIYFLHNISKKSLWIDHPVEGQQSAKAGWSSFFQPGKWSAILINRKDFALSCAIIEPGKVNYQDCAKAITVCSPQDVTFNSKRKGSYWLAEDKSYEDLLFALTKRGVEFGKIAAAKEIKKSKAEGKKPTQEVKNEKEVSKKTKTKIELKKLDN